MRKKVEVFLVDGYKLVLHNKDTYMGCYYGEDDWSIEIVAEDLDTLQRLAIEKIIESRVVEAGKDLYKVTYLEYEGNKYIVTEEECSYEKVRKVFENIITSERYKSLLKLREEEDEKKKIEEQERLEKARIEQEKKQYEKLREKYEKD